MPQNKQTTAAGAASKIRIFRKNRRAWFSLWILAGLLVLSLLAEFLANDRPLLVKYKGEWYFPLFNTYLDRDFGGDFPTPADYADPYIRKNIEQNGWMLMPIIPYSFNTVDMEMDQPTPAAPSARHWLGTDDEGRDILARILYGLRLSPGFLPGPDLRVAEDLPGDVLRVPADHRQLLRGLVPVGAVVYVALDPVDVVGFHDCHKSTSNMICSQPTDDRGCPMPCAPRRDLIQCRWGVC